MTSDRDRWTPVMDIITAAGRDPGSVIRQAERDQVSPEFVLERFTRSSAARKSFDPRKPPPFDNFDDSWAPGTYDPRVFNQTAWWVDYWRVTHRIDEMSADELMSLIQFCHRSAGTMCIAYHRLRGDRIPTSPLAWVNATKLLAHVRERLRVLP